MKDSAPNLQIQVLDWEDVMVHITEERPFINK